MPEICIVFLGCEPWGITEILIDVLAFLSNDNGPYASVIDYKKCRPPCRRFLSLISPRLLAALRFPAFLAHSTCVETAKLPRLILIKEVRSYNRALKFTCFFISSMYGTGVPSSRCEELLLFFLTLCERSAREM